MEDIALKLESDLGKRLEKNVSMRERSKLGVGGVADYLFPAKTADDLVRAISAACRLDLPYRVIGRGNDVIFSDSGFGGLLIVNESNHILFSPDASEVMVDSGVDLPTMINLAASRDLGGLEFLAGLNNTIGGALYHNLSLNGSSIGDFVRSATVVMEKNGEIAIANVTGDWLRFVKDSSKIKSKSRSDFQPVVLTARVQLIRRRKDEILKMIHVALNQRLRTMPMEKRAIQTIFCDPESAAVSQLLRDSGATRFRAGGAMVSRHDSNSIVNVKDATANDVRMLTESMRAAVLKKSGITLEERIEYLGQW